MQLEGDLLVAMNGLAQAVLLCLGMHLRPPYWNKMRKQKKKTKELKTTS